MGLLACGPRGGVVIPFGWSELAVLNLGEGVDEVSAQTGVNVFGKELSTGRSVLAPVCVVTHHHSPSSCQQGHLIQVKRMRQIVRV